MKINPITEWGQHFAQKLDLTPYKKVLDLGCRQGHISALLAQQYPHQQFFATDNVQNEIDQAKTYHLPNLEFAVQDALSLPFSGDFDGIFSVGALLWIKDKKRFLQQIYRALKPGGKAFLQFFATHGRLKNDWFLYETANNVKWQSYFKGFKTDYHEISLEAFCRLLQSTGFIIHRAEFVRYPFHFEHTNELKQWFGSWATHIKYLPLKKQQHFIDQTTQSYLTYHHISSNQTPLYHEYLLEVICEKSFNSMNITSNFQFTHLQFSQREAQILKHFLQGQSAKEIGQWITLSPKTVEFHLAKIKQKLNCHKRSQIYQAAISYGFIDLIFDTEL